MGGRSAGKGFEYQDLCALLRVTELFEIGAEQFVQVEDLHKEIRDRKEPWDFRILNSDPPSDWRFREEYWQAKNTSISKGQYSVFWKNLHSAAHGKSFDQTSTTPLRSDVGLGIVTSSKLRKEVDRFRQFAELLRLLRDDKGRNDIKEILQEDFLGAELDSFVEQLTSGRVKSVSKFDVKPESEETVFRFQQFFVENYSESGLRDRILLNCSRRLGVLIPDVNESFDVVCGAALTHIRRNYGVSIPFKTLTDLLEGSGGQKLAPRAVIGRILDRQKKLVDSLVSDRVSLGELFVQPKGFADSPNNTSQSQDSSSDVLPWLLSKMRGDTGLTLVLGDFGHGKTTLFKFAAATLARDWTQGDPIPVFVPLRRYFENNGNFHDLVAESLAGSVEVTKSLWRSQRWNIFCDGFDELNALYQDRPDWVRGRFESIYRASIRENINVALSSRPILFLDPHVNEKHFSSFDRNFLSPFNSGQISEWLLNNRDTLTFEDLQDRKIDEIASTPVILSLISQLHRAGKLEIRNYRRVEIYEEFFRWVASSGGALEADERLSKHESLAREALQKIAVHLFSHPESKSGLMWVPQLLDELKYDGFHFDERVFVRHAFHEGRPDFVEFLHQSLREYLIADLCFQEIFRFDSDSTWLPKLRMLLFESPLTSAKVSLFREMVEVFADREGADFIGSFSTTWEWPEILWLLQNELLDDTLEVYESLGDENSNADEIVGRLAFFPFSRRIDDHLSREMISTSLQVPVGNIALLTFLAQAVYFSAIGKRNEGIMSEFLGLKRFLSSYHELEPLSTILASSLSNLKFQGSHWPVQHEIFLDYKLLNTQLLNIKFEWCSWEKALFIQCAIGGETQFNQCRFSDCSFRNCEFSTVVFNNCFFSDTSNLFEEALRGGETILFENCTFDDDGASLAKRHLAFKDCRFLGNVPRFSVEQE